MTGEEAARILDPETVRDALWEYDRPEARLKACSDACRIAAAVLRGLGKGDRPLTLEELREMDGEPVWTVSIRGEYPPEWMLVNVEERSLFNSCGDYLEFYDVGRNVLAYRRRPEEGAT